MVQEGGRYPVKIENWASDGSGVARVEGMAVFVKGGIVGERCVVEVEHVGHRAAWGHIAQLLEASPARIQPDCPYFGACGGCALQHMDYQTELAFKTDKITQALSRIGGLTVEGLTVHGDAQPRGYRNKVQFPVGKGGEIGFYRPRSHQVVEVERCFLHDPSMDGPRQVVKDWMAAFAVPPYDESRHTGLVRHLYLRSNARGGMLCVVVVNGKSVPHEKELVERLRALPGVEGILLNVNTRRTNVVLGPENRLLWGKDYLEDALCGVTFRLSPHSFYQVNHDQAQRLYERVGELAGLTGSETVLDLYCGTGTIGLTLAGRCKSLLGAEIVPAAIADARENARRNGVENARFVCADAAEIAAQLAQTGEKIDVAIVDPPRKGLSPQVLESLLQIAPRRLVYVSCDPATLARDLKGLSRQYRLVTAEGFDLFPRTEHVETVCLLAQRKSGGQH